MTKHTYSRLQLPALRTLGGFALAATFGISKGWLVGVFIAAISLLTGFVWYVIGGDHTDVGDLVGGRGDERQRQIRLQAAGVSLAVVIAALLVASIVAAAAGASVWPYVGTIAFAGVVYVAALRIYGLGSGEEAERPPASIRGRRLHF